MIAITPIPPTISAMEEITISDRNVARLIWSHSASTASWVMNSKSFGSSSRSPCRIRITRSMSAIATSLSTSACGTAAIITARISPPNIRWPLIPNCF